MGSSSSKTRRIGGDGSIASSPSSSFSSSFSSAIAGSSAGNSGGSRRREKSKTRRIFGSSCLGSSSRAYDSDDEHEISDHCDEVRGPRIRQIESESDEVKVEHYQTVKVDGSDEVPRVSSNVALGDWTHASRTDNVNRAGGSSSQSLSGRSFNNSSRFLSRFSFVPESVSFRLSRAASVGSSRAYPSSPTSFTIPSAEDDLHLRRGSYGLINRNENQQIGSVNSSCPSSSSTRNDDSVITLVRNNAGSSPLSTSVQHNRVISAQDLVDDDSERIRPDDCLTPFGSRMDIGSINSRLGDHRNGTREPVDRNVRFSRTLSVGRLRDRVLRRSSFSDMTLSPLQNEGTAATNENPVNSLISSPYPLPSTRNPFHTNQNNDEISHLREARRHDLLEHRSNFLERRRRIRSQVRALQRLGSRFENLSGHDRYCILSGQHRTGRCSCHTGTRDSNSNDDGAARGSISRIVMLAEALFEVLDEIHQQSVALSSRPSVSSIGSVPAPSEVVESLPVKVYSKKTKVQCEDVAQCYICLVEYDEGDDVRILPCHHEFHKKCIDKWLKEIHRVCPLCRGDICRLESSSAES